MLERATGPQGVLLEAAVRFVAVLAAQPILLRAAAYFLLHAGVGLRPAQVGAAVGRTDRAMRTVRAPGDRSESGDDRRRCEGRARGDGARRQGSVGRQIS